MGHSVHHDRLLGNGTFEGHKWTCKMESTWIDTITKYPVSGNRRIGRSHLLGCGRWRPTFHPPPRPIARRPLIGSLVADICRGRHYDESGTTVIQTEREQKNDMWSSSETRKKKFKKKKGTDTRQNQNSISDVEFDLLQHCSTTMMNSDFRFVGWGCCFGSTRHAARHAPLAFDDASPPRVPQSRLGFNNARSNSTHRQFAALQ